jgi:hypothetical protein
LVAMRTWVSRPCLLPVVSSPMGVDHAHTSSRHTACPHIGTMEAMTNRLLRHTHEGFRPRPSEVTSLGDQSQGSTSQRMTAAGWVGPLEACIPYSTPRRTTSRFSRGCVQALRGLYIIQRDLAIPLDLSVVASAPLQLACQSRAHLPLAAAVEPSQLPPATCPAAAALHQRWPSHG